MNKLKQMLLTERDMRQLIKEALEEISIIDKYNLERSKTKWNEDEFRKICLIDPTYNSEKDIVGKYTNWLLRQIENIGQLEYINKYLEWYAIAMKKGILQRNGIPTDINQFRSIEQFIDTIDNAIHQDSGMSQSEYNNRNKLEGQFDVIGENEDYEVIYPKTFAAERYFGTGTMWCTVASEKSFNDYNNVGNLYILYPKNRDKTKKIQFHLESNSYANYKDKIFNDPISCLLSIYDENDKIIDKLVELLKKTFGDKFSWLRYISLSKISDLLKQGVNPNDIFDNVYPSSEGVNVVNIGKMYNAIKNKNKLISPRRWYYNVENFYEDTAIVTVNASRNNKNVINKRGKLLFNKCYSDIKRIRINDEIVYIVKKNDTIFIFKGNGCPFIQKGFSHYINSNNDCILMGDDFFTYLIDKNGNITSKYDRNGNMYIPHPNTGELVKINDLYQE